MNKSLRVCVVFIASFASVITAFAYNISGTTLAALPSQFAYNPYAGLTTYTLSCSRTRHIVSNGKDPSTCKYTSTGTIENVVWSVTTSVSLPNWTNKSSATQNAQNEWDRFMVAASVHENGHVSIANSFITVADNVYTPQLTSLNITGIGDTQDAADADASSQLISEANAVNADAIDNLDDLQDEYDDDNNHGASQGAVLDTSIN